MTKKKNGFITLKSSFIVIIVVVLILGGLIWYGYMKFMQYAKQHPNGGHMEFSGTVKTSVHINKPGAIPAPGQIYTPQARQYCKLYGTEDISIILGSGHAWCKFSDGSYCDIQKFYTNDCQKGSQFNPH